MHFFIILTSFFCLISGTRETAFIYSILSAGVVHSVTQACTAGNLTTCTCDVSAREGEHTVEGWKWGGCSDNVKYGIEFSRQFVDAPESSRSEKSTNIRNRMNLHNNEVGRKVMCWLIYLLIDWLIGGLIDWLICVFVVIIPPLSKTNSDIFCFQYFNAIGYFKKPICFTNILVLFFTKTKNTRKPLVITYTMVPYYSCKIIQKVHVKYV